MALEQMVEKPVRLVGDRIGMGIGEERATDKILIHGLAARHMHFLDQAGRQGVEKRVGVKPVISGIEIKILNIQQQPGAGEPVQISN